MGKVLVTGATGFTGGALARRLIESGEEVVAFVRSGSRTGALEGMGAEIRQVDIRDPESVNDNFSGIDRVYHIAAAWRTEHSDLEEFRRVNAGAVKNLLEASKSAGVKRFVHCSTVGVHGHIDDPPADETYRYKPGDHYQSTKLEGELIARDYFRNGLPGTVVRPAGIYGPGDLRFLKLFRPINKGLFVMIGSGNVYYHFTYVDDLVSGFLLAGTHPDALGEPFIIASDEYITLRDLVKTIAEVLGKPAPKLRVPYYPVYMTSVVCDKVCRAVGVTPPLYPRRVEFFIKDRAFTIEKAKRILGYQPQVALREGLARTAEWYKSQGYIS